MDRMIYGTALILLLDLALVLTMFTPDGDCDFTETISQQQVLAFENPNWPATYMAGATCRWTFDCPVLHACRLRCLDIGLPQTADCYMDKLLVSGSGNPQLEGAIVYCGRTEINYKSVGSTMTLALVTSKLSPGGRFRCTIRVEPSWFNSPWTPNAELLNRTDSKREEKKKHLTRLITPARANNHKRDRDISRKRVYSDLPNIGLIQTRPYTAYNSKLGTQNSDLRAAKMNGVESVHGNVRGKFLIIAQPKYIQTVPSYTGPAEEELASAEIIQEGAAYQDPIEEPQMFNKRDQKEQALSVTHEKILPVDTQNTINEDFPYFIRVEKTSQKLRQRPVKTVVKYERHGQSEAETQAAKHKHHLRTSLTRGTHLRNRLVRASKANNIGLKESLPILKHRDRIPSAKRARTHRKRYAHLHYPSHNTPLYPYITIREVRQSNKGQVAMFSIL